MTTTKINQDEEMTGLNSLLKLILLFFILGCAVGRSSLYIFPIKEPTKIIIKNCPADVPPSKNTASNSQTDEI